MLLPESFGRKPHHPLETPLSYCHSAYLLTNINPRFDERTFSHCRLVSCQTRLFKSSAYWGKGSGAMCAIIRSHNICPMTLTVLKQQFLEYLEQQNEPTHLTPRSIERLIKYYVTPRPVLLALKITKLSTGSTCPMVMSDINSRTDTIWSLTEIEPGIVL